MDNALIIQGQSIISDVSEQDDLILHSIRFYKSVIHALNVTNTAQEANHIRATTRSVNEFMKQKLPLIMKDRAERLHFTQQMSFVWLETCAKAGEIWQQTGNRRKSGGDQKSENHSENFRNDLSWYDAGFSSDRDVTSCVRAAELGIDERRIYYEECKRNEKPGTLSGIENVWREFFKIETLNSSETNEWYTPIEYIQAARQVLGQIDIDPASNEYAQQVIKAATYYTAETNGLDKEWRGKCWLNPPYGDLCPRFVARLLEQYNAGNVTEAILLVNSHAVETNWFSPLWNYLLCFTDHRINFINPEGAKNGSTHGSVFVYFGNNEPAFYEAFKPFGYIVKQVRYDEHS